MLLCIDGGNTNVVFALFENDKILNQWRMNTNSRTTADEYGVWLINLFSLSGFNIDEVEATAITNVVPSISFQLRELCKRYFGVTPICIESAEDVPIPVLIDNPAEVGADRLVNAVAAHEYYTGGLIVIDFGTATTFDVVREDGAYAGGIIAPGVNLSLDALDRAAARLPSISIKRPEHILGKNTVSAMQSGMFWGYVSLIEGLVSRINIEFDTKMTVIATGGLAPLFQTSCEVIDSIDENLTLNGLRLLYENIASSPK
ncbi:MAG: pantothenate kinase [Rhodospirillaceae bacterium]|nr:pantothenate kinase [Rhodospirillaceae bacterium]